MSKHPTGWRCWGLTTDERGPVLASPEFGRAIPGLTYGEREAWATCFERDHKPPKPRCACGLYSADSMDAARVWLPPNVAVVVGRVALLGRAIEGSPVPVNMVMDELLPLISTTTGRSTSAEYRSAGVRLKGPQRLHPQHAKHAAALADRYGVPFRVDPTLAEPFDVAGDLVARGLALRAKVREFLRPQDVAGLVLFNETRSHVVLQLRSEAVDHPDTWAFIGGAVESRETPTEAALREGWEEARLDQAEIRVERELDLPGQAGEPRYTYVIATAEWEPSQDWVLPHSANWEARGAGWVPIGVLDDPARFPAIRLHPELEKTWPRVRAMLDGAR